MKNLVLSTRPAPGKPGRFRPRARQKLKNSDHACIAQSLIRDDFPQQRARLADSAGR
jgi:hypothetical protein